MIGSFRYKPFKNHYLLTNDAGRHVFLTAEHFQSFISGKMDTESETWAGLKNKLFCSNESVESYLQNTIDAVRDNHAYLFSSTSLFIFAMTNQCNNRCVYCQADGCSAASMMSKEVAEQALDRIYETPARNITIEFQGGEPFLNWETIEFIVRNAKEKLPNKCVNFAIVSNLSLLTEKMADFIAEHKISISTSLDGPQRLHDLNRPQLNGQGSYDAMIRGLTLLQARGLEVGAIQTTTKASLPYAKEIVNEYARLGFTSVFLRPLTRLGAASRRWHEIGYAPEEFLNFYQEGLSAILDLNRRGTPFFESHASIFLSKILDGYSPNYMELRSPCGATIGQIAFAPNGDVYTCDEGRMLAEMGDSAFKLGNVANSGYSDWLDSSVCKAVCSASLLETLPGCCDCVYQPYCGVCPIVNYALEGSLISSHPNNDRCKVYKGMLDTLFTYLLEADETTLSNLRNWIGNP